MSVAPVTAQAHSATECLASALERPPRCLPSHRNAIQRLYKKYSAADGEENIGVEGISLLCSDLGVEPDDAVVLVLR